MKKFTLPCAMLLLSFCACNNAADNQQTSGDTSVATTATPAATRDVAGCYRMVLNGKDTVGLQLSAEANRLTGPLYYHWYEKDKNDGVFSGTQNNDRIQGWYSFESEGMNSVRELIWKIDGDKLYPATGDIDQHGDSIVFKDPETVSFDTTHYLTKVDCEKAIPQ